MQVRPIASGEADQLRKIRLRSLAEDPDAFGSTYERDAARPTDWWQNRAASTEQATFVIIDEHERWLGLALVRPDTGPEAVINAMWVAAEARRQGAGRMLLDACLEWARSRHFRSVTLSVKADNAPARAAYAAAGFKLLRKAGDEHVLQLDLAGNPSEA
jgi:ribosomal protein S18 acetylase RimI-like enzyme